MPYHYRPRKCKWCKESFTPERVGQKTHSHCEEPFALKVVQKLVARRQSVDIRKRKEAIKTIPQLIALAQKDFNAYIRERDKDKPCICCGVPLAAGGGGSRGGAFDCGHYRSTGSASHLRFDERNAHGQRKICNRYGAGRAVDYRVGLIARIGVEAVEALEADNTTRKWTREALIAIRAEFKAKRKELEVCE